MHEKNDKKNVLFCENVFFTFGTQFGGSRDSKMGAKISHLAPKTTKKLIFGRPFLDQHSFRVEKVSWGSPESIFGPLEVNFNDSRGRISWIFALNFCLLICTPHWMRRSSLRDLNKRDNKKI